MTASLPRVSLLATALAVVVSTASADPTTYWAEFQGAPSVDTPYTLPLSPGSQVTVTLSTGGTQGMSALNLGTLGTAETGLAYDDLNLLTIFNGGGNTTVSTSLTFSNVQVGDSHKRGLLLVGAINSQSSPVTVTSSVPGRVATWTVVGSFDYTPSNSFPILWNPGTGTFETSAPIANDSKFIVIDVGDLETDGTITISLNQFLNDGIACAFGEELFANVDVPPSSGHALSFQPVRPNPARSNATLEFSLPHDSRVRVDLYDVTGRHLARLADREFEAGDHAIAWNLRDDSGSRVPAGLVFARLSTPAGMLTRRLLVTR